MIKKTLKFNIYIYIKHFCVYFCFKLYLSLTSYLLHNLELSVTGIFLYFIMSWKNIGRANCKTLEKALKNKNMLLFNYMMDSCKLSENDKPGWSSIFYSVCDNNKDSHIDNHNYYADRCGKQWSNKTNLNEPYIIWESTNDRRAPRDLLPLYIYPSTTGCSVTEIASLLGADICMKTRKREIANRYKHKVIEKQAYLDKIIVIISKITIIFLVSIVILSIIILLFKYFNF